MKRLLIISLVVSAFCGVSLHAMHTKKVAVIELNTKEAPYNNESGCYIPVLYKVKGELDQEADLKVDRFIGRENTVTNDYKLDFACGHIIVGSETVGEKNISLQKNNQQQYIKQNKEILSGWITSKKVELKSNLLADAKKKETPKLSKKPKDKTSDGSGETTGLSWKKLTFGGFAVAATLVVSFVLYKYLKR